MSPAIGFGFVGVVSKLNFRSGNWPILPLATTEHQLHSCRRACWFPRILARENSMHTVKIVSLIFGFALAAAACGDSKSSLNPTAPSALSADSVNVEADGAALSGSMAKGPKPGNGNGNGGNGNGNGNGNSGGNSDGVGGDDDNGHGNDAGGVDSSNPGNGGSGGNSNDGNSGRGRNK